MKDLFIAVNRRKMLMLTLMYGAIGLIAFLGLYYFGEGLKHELGKIGTTIFKALSVIALVIFVVVASSYGKKIKDKSAGLGINRDGITDETTSIAIGLVKWKEIKEIVFLKSLTSTSILIHVKKPDLYLKQAKNKAVARLLSQNLTIYKTPIVINASILDVGLEKLTTELTESANRYGSNIKIK